MITGTLVYDADCGFCTRTATWLANDSCGIQPWQALDLDTFGLTEADVTAAAFWLDARDRVAERGAGAIALALQTRTGVAGFLGKLITTRLVRPTAEVVYAGVSRHRQALPGGELCAVAEQAAASKAPKWAIGIYAIFFVAWVVGFSMTAHQNEPFPALMQPRFQTIPGVSERLDVTYTLTLSDGEIVRLDSADIFPPSAGKRLSIANHVLTEERTEDPQTREWLTNRIQALDLFDPAVSLTISKARVVNDPRGGSVTTREVLSEWIVPLGGTQ